LKGEKVGRLILAGILFVTFSHPNAAHSENNETFVITAGLSSYNPALEHVREELRDAGGGNLVAIDDYREKTLFLALASIKRNKYMKQENGGKEINYFRYRGRSESNDYLLELENFSGAILTYFYEDGEAFESYWGGGINLIRMKREGSVEVRGTPRITQKDWLWGFNAFFGFDYLISASIGLGTRYTYHFTNSTILDSIEYSLSGGTISYSISLYFPSSTI